MDGGAARSTRRSRAVVVRAAGQLAAVEELLVAAPAANEVLVRVQAAGLCHTDIEIASGRLWPHYPVVLGHEIAGVVVEKGDAVTGVAVGQRVLVLDGHCGRCTYCEGGRSVLCQTFDRAERDHHFRDHRDVTVRQGVGGFSELLIAPMDSIFPVPDDVPPEVAAITGCAVVTGFGAVTNMVHVGPETSVAVVGCGGVGLNAVMTAIAVGATTVVAIDPDPSRQAIGCELGASDALAPGIAGVLDRYPRGFDVVIECAGRVEAMTEAVELVARGGTAIMVGAPAPDVKMRVGALDLILNQRSVVGCLRGNVRPSRDLPMIFDLYRSGKLRLDRLVTDRITIDELPVRLSGQPVDGSSVRTVVAY